VPFLPAAALLVLLGSSEAAPLDLPPPPNVWVKLSPLPGGPPSPRLGYEGACAWDAKHRILIRYGGHNQGGGGEHHWEVWTFDPRTAVWTLNEPDASPPGVCCAQQDIFDPVRGRFLRFPAFSGSHGWQWWREIYLNDSSVWAYDLATNTWRDLCPLPAARPRPLRCASWDAEHEVVVRFSLVPARVAEVLRALHGRVAPVTRAALQQFAGNRPLRGLALVPGRSMEEAGRAGRRAPTACRPLDTAVGWGETSYRHHYASARMTLSAPSGLPCVADSSNSF
jgi:hypothetical protein